jgi:tetratricopeptide (TPR) repeat protein
MSPNPLRRPRWILAAAVAAVPLFGFVSGAAAQYRVETAGRALDANNRIGSGGRNPNDSTNRTGDMVSGNDIVLGNVTGGKQFHGNVPYSDPDAFRGFTAGRASDNFVKQSAGPDTTLTRTVEPFYGTSRGVAPPPNTQQLNYGSVGYVPSPGIVNRQLGDERMGALYFQPSNPLPQPGELVLPGPVDPSAGRSMITASPLYGVRTWTPGEELPMLENTQYNPVRGPLSDSEVQRLRNELNSTGGLTPNASKQGNETSPNNAGGADQQGEQGDESATPGTAKPLSQAKPLTPLTGNAANPLVQARPLGTAVAARPNDAATDQTTRLRMLVPPQSQSSLYAEMLKRHNESVKDTSITDAQAAQAYNAAVQASKDRAKNPALANQQPGEPGAPGQPGAAPGVPGAVAQRPPTPAGAAPGAVAALPSGGTPGAAPGTPGAAPGATKPPPVTDFAARNEALLRNGANAMKDKTKKPEPVQVKSFATGVKAPGLSELLTKAEGLMKQGRFTSALDQYDAAEQVAPNNPMIRLGRANAELGAAYYARAESHLREVFTTNPELLVGQYDLRSLLGEERLAVLVKELKDISNKDQKQARPVFLLAYIYYNIGQEQKAEAYLDLAEKRAGGQDKFFNLLRENWTLASDKAAAGKAPAETPPAEKTPAEKIPEQEAPAKVLPTPDKPAPAPADASKGANDLNK